VLDVAQDWFARATTHWRDWPADELLAAKGEHRISVVVPARNEAATVGDVVSSIRRDLMTAVSLVDELVVMDSDSDDATAQLAAAAGARVHRVRDVRPDLEGAAGKGEALWKAQFVTTGDVLVFIDADLTGWGTHFVSGLLGPLLSDPSVELVKGFYDRVLEGAEPAHAPQGGRVTELVARPLLNLYWPELAAVVQPLAGEWAVRRARFASLTVPVGYGVELATLLDVWAAAGLPALAQVDLGARAHSHQSVHDLGLMAAEIIAVAAARVPAAALSNPATDLAQFGRDDEPWTTRVIPHRARPPAAGLGN
jgi:glucosyl-3-phosphoglycerate synthase